MTCVNVAEFVLVSQLEKDHSMNEMHRLKNVVIFIQTILSFVLSRKTINIYNDIAHKYENVTVKDFQKYQNLDYKKSKLKLDINFFNNCKQLGVYPKFLIFAITSSLYNTTCNRFYNNCVINICPWQ